MFNPGNGSFPTIAAATFFSPKSGREYQIRTPAGTIFSARGQPQAIFLAGARLRGPDQLPLISAAAIGIRFQGSLNKEQGNHTA